jgi:hypothetical protein
MFQQFLFLNWGAKVKIILTNENVLGKSFGDWRLRIEGLESGIWNLELF